jgi:hypothetical protein
MTASRSCRAHLVHVVGSLCGPQDVSILALDGLLLQRFFQVIQDCGDAPSGFPCCLGDDPGQEIGSVAELRNNFAQVFAALFGSQPGRGTRYECNGKLAKW